MIIVSSLYTWSSINSIARPSQGSSELLFTEVLLGLGEMAVVGVVNLCEMEVVNNINGVWSVVVERVTPVIYNVRRENLESFNLATTELITVYLISHEERSKEHNSMIKSGA